MARATAIPEVTARATGSGRIRGRPPLVAGGGAAARSVGGVADAGGYCRGSGAGSGLNGPLGVLAWAVGKLGGVFAAAGLAAGLVAVALCWAEHAVIASRRAAADAGRAAGSGARLRRSNAIIAGGTPVTSSGGWLCSIMSVISPG
jgi:hypothetical protein